MTTIFEALREDHDKQRSLMKMLCETEGDSENRRYLYAETKRELERHAAAEERYFYVPLMQDSFTQEKSRHSVAEHHEIDELIEELDATDLSAPQWLVTAKKLQDMVLHHLEEEEQEVFQMAGKVLADPDKTRLASDYRAMMDGSAG